jgi:DNA repair protein RadC
MKKSLVPYLTPRYKVQLVRDQSVDPASYGFFCNSKDIYNKFRDDLMSSDREVLMAIVLDSKNKLIGTHVVSIGSMSSSLAHPREVFKVAILLNGAAMIFLHNHPSGDPAPSREDRNLTDRLCMGGKILGIHILDHIIAGDSEYFSFADAGLLQEDELNKRVKEVLG